MNGFTCPQPQCNSTFPLKKSLTRHLKTVHQDQNHECLLCGDTFARKDNLDRHRQEQHGEKTGFVECAICGKEVRERVLSTHWKSRKCQKKQRLMQRCIEESEHESQQPRAHWNGNTDQSCASILPTGLDARSALLASILAVFHIKITEWEIGSDLTLRSHHLVNALNYRGLAMHLLQDGLANMASSEAVGSELSETYLSILALLYTDCCLKEQQAAEYHGKALNALEQRHFDKFSVGALDRMAYHAVCHGLQNIETTDEDTQHDLLDHVPNRPSWDRKRELRLLDVLCRAHSLQKDALDKPYDAASWKFHGATADTLWEMLSWGALSRNRLAIEPSRRSDDSVTFPTGTNEETLSFSWIDGVPEIVMTERWLDSLSSIQWTEESPSDAVWTSMLSDTIGDNESEQHTTQGWHADRRTFRFPKDLRKRPRKRKWSV